MSALTSKEFVLSTMRKYGRATAQGVQEQADEMTGTELHEEIAFIPSFYAAIAKCNMLDRPVGFVCRTPQGRVVRLLQPYDSDVYKEEPEQLPAQWGFKWSKDPKHALPFISLSTSPYEIGDCCIDEGKVYCSILNTNTWRPSEFVQGWKLVEE